MPDAPLLVTVALNGYARRYAECVSTQDAWARRMGYDRLLADKPSRPVPRADTAWLKIELLTRALDAGRPWVMVLDCDAAVAADAPDFRAALDADNDVGLVLGRSGRVNSGVIVVRNTASSREVFDTVARNRGAATPDATWRDWVDWGENAHVISATRDYAGLQILGPEWNDSDGQVDHAHITHFTGSQRIVPTRVERLRAAWFRGGGRLAGRLQKEQRTRLDALLRHNREQV